MRQPLPSFIFTSVISWAFFASPLHAQLYTWKDQQGNVVIKNAPPAWYSESDRLKGARVQVLRNGAVVDDTEWPVQRRQEGRNKDARDEAKRAQSEAPASAQPSKAPAKDDDE